MGDITLMHSLESAESSTETMKPTMNQSPSTPQKPAPPLQRATSPSTSTSTSTSTSPRTTTGATQQHTRSASIATSAPSRKRLSLSFPILPSNSNISPRNVSPVTTSPQTYTSMPDTEHITPDDPMAFLTALAGQERRVLELKEELGKAETELRKMKKQWAIHEATRKMHDLTTPISTSSGGVGAGVGGGRLQPLDTTGGGVGEVDKEKIVSPTREQYNARKATLNSLNGTGRKVLPSQRHQRTLSLLSTDRNSLHKQPFSQPSILDGDDDDDDDDDPPSVRRSQTFAQTAPTAPAAAAQSIRPLSMNDFPRSAGQKGQEALLRTGKQMAEDFKEGLWTFIEDLRQATVGDEGIHSSVGQSGIRATTNTQQDNGTKALNKKSSRTSLRSISPAKMSREASKNPTPTPTPTPTKEKKEKDKETLVDTPTEEGSSKPPRWSTSSVTSETTGVATPPSHCSTPRTSTSSTTSNNPLWTSVISTQFNLKKTATALMTSVEKSLAAVPASADTATTGFYSPGRDVGHLRSRSRSPEGKSKKA